MSKRGFMYTLVAILVLMIIGSVFFTQVRRTGREIATAESDRVLSINRFIRALEEDSQRAAYISGFRSMIAMEQYIASTGEFLPNTDTTFREVFLNGTINGTPYDIMNESYFNDFVGRVQVVALRQGILFNATVSDVRLWQMDPWSVLVNYTMGLNVTDLRGSANWRANYTFVGTIAITDLRDPLFTVYTFGRVQRVVKPTNVSPFVNDAGNMNDTTGLMTQFNNSLYAVAGRGPSLLMRFAGNISDSPYGVESFIDVDEFTIQGLAVNTSASVVDYLYFNGTPATACTIQEMPARFKLDDAHLSFYEVSGALTYGACP